ncbi:hypothetical protein BDZ91DRAFT_660288 [Kalaharituber pfeilii]|nr:hypothetical protein BDZ91DRAFT_660288 [Kalaharituber pfeilii]
MYALPKSIIALILLLGAVLAYALPSSEIIKRDDPPWPAVNIESIGYAGSGCSAGTVKVEPQNNFQEVKLTFDAYVASIGPGVPITEKRKNCVITILVTRPPGWCVALYKGDYTVRVELDWGVNAIQQSDYWWGGETATFKSSWDGPIAITKPFYDLVPKLVWSGPTDTILKIDTQVRLDNSMNPAGTGLIATESISNKVMHVYHLDWEKC